MEKLETYEAINLSGIILEHMHRIMKVKNSKHGIAYGYLLNWVFYHFGGGLVGTIKQTFLMTTLIECKCVEGKYKAKSHVSELFEKQEALKWEMKDFTTLLGDKEVEITLLTAFLQQEKSQRPCTSTNTKKEINRLRSNNDKLTK